MKSIHSALYMIRERNRVLFLLSGIFVFNIIFRSLYLFQAPEGLSIQEIRIISFLPYSFHAYAFYFRFVSVVVASLAALLFSFAIYRKTNKISYGLITGIVFAVEPWSFVYSRSVNYAPFILLYVSLLFSIAVTRGKLSLYLFLPFALVFLRPLSLNFSINEVRGLLQSADIVSLFFSGDQQSAYLRIPRTGFLLFVDLPFLLLGIYILSNNDKYKRILQALAYCFVFAVLFFFFNPGTIPAERFGPIFIIATLVVSMGYGFIFEKTKKYRLFRICVIFAVVINILFYQELFYHHFDKKNSTEWGYAELNLIKYLETHPEINTLLITQQKDYLPSYILFFMKGINFKKLPENTIQKDCPGKYNYKCILKEDELPRLGLDKSKIPVHFDNKGGLPEFFLL